MSILVSKPCENPGKTGKPLGDNVEICPGLAKRPEAGFHFGQNKYNEREAGNDLQINEGGEA